MARDFQDAIERLVSSNRILVLGSSGSGKTTFSTQLGTALGLDVIHLDAEFWQPGWISTPQDVWRHTVARLVERERWIMDGTYESTLHLRIPAADCLILVHQPRLLCLWRIIKRKATIDDHARPDAPAGQRIDWPFIRYVWNYPTVTEPLVNARIREFGLDKAVIELDGDRQIEGLLRELTRDAPSVRASSQATRDG